MEEVKLTVKEVLIGIGIYFLVVEVIGLIFVDDRLGYTLGLLIGTIVAGITMYHMYVTLGKALDMEPSRASKYTRRCSFIRLFIMFIGLTIGIVLTKVSFLAVFIGVLGLKIGALMQPFINKYISTKIYKEGR